ncbi:MAG: hypothetical protein ACLQGP_06420 [Isosphaeraceae bacterium]
MKTPRRAAVAALTAGECKIRAAILLKDLLSDETPRVVRAAERFPVLPAFASLDPDAIVGRRESIRLKHALAVIAAELGYPNWTACKRRLEVPASLRLAPERFFESRNGEPMGAAYLNRWFGCYDEARASLEAEGGHLFPFRHQFFICESGFLEARGIDTADPDWARIGRDWVRPIDEEARGRLERKLIASGNGGREGG